MRTMTESTREAEEVADRNMQKLVVTWQHPESRDIFPIGVLAWDGQSYSFDYLSSVEGVEDFRPLLGLKDTTRHYESAELFPIFQERVLDPRRPDYQRYVSDLRLDESSASPWEQLTRSGGSSAGDTLQLYPTPVYDGILWTIRFLVNGVRYMTSKTVDVRGAVRGGYSDEELEAVLASLHHGQPLSVVHESTNSKSPNAMLVLTAGDAPIGYVPNWLSREVLPVVDDGVLRCVVDQVNPSEAGWHLRVLALLEMSLPADYDFLAGERWQLASA